MEDFEDKVARISEARMSDRILHEENLKNIRGEQNMINEPRRVAIELVYSAFTSILSDKGYNINFYDKKSYRGGNIFVEKIRNGQPFNSHYDLRVEPLNGEYVRIKPTNSEIGRSLGNGLVTEWDDTYSYYHIDIKISEIENLIASYYEAVEFSFVKSKFNISKESRGQHNKMRVVLLLCLSLIFIYFILKQ